MGENVHNVHILFKPKRTQFHRNFIKFCDNLKRLKKTFFGVQGAKNAPIEKKAWLEHCDMKGPIH
jgi:hypothetical protein